MAPTSRYSYAVRGQIGEQKGKSIHLALVDHLSPEREIDQAEGAVLTPLIPQEQQNLR